MSLRYTLSASGGALYHLIAFRRAKTRWFSFRAHVKAWLTEWRPDSSRDLIIFGPSAGWTLPLELLARAGHITINEPDPLARRLLSWRLKAAGVDLQKIEWITSAHILPWFAKSEGDFAKFLAERPSADILFANVLGQVPLHFSKELRNDSGLFREQFFAALKQRSWASYHDLYSGPRPATVASLKAQIPDEDLAAAVFTHGAITDHETIWLSQDRAIDLALWPITESQTHLIGFVRNEEIIG